MGFRESKLPIMGLRVGMLPRIESPGFKYCLTNQLCNLRHFATSLHPYFHICKNGKVVSTVS